ncbi:ATP-binding protein [Buchnera aphidicola]|uniref:ATP-binding protein n=1 Tax=Buchnera aphidicola TaxID=9 RepID=UPI00346437B5
MYILKRLKKIIPHHIKPKFTKDTELLKWNQQQGQLSSKNIIQKNNTIKKNNLIKNSGIQTLHINCSFRNYNLKYKEQKYVLNKSIQYAKNFNKNQSNFVFLGLPGTGKNHLATAIAKYLISQKKKVCIITISELMLKIKSTFKNTNNKITEKKFIHYLSNIDLLILDEIGIQTKSQYEKMILHQIIDKRYSSNKSTGILSNLNTQSIYQLLGRRIMDRINLKNTLWLHFNWKSYRKYYSS